MTIYKVELESVVVEYDTEYHGSPRTLMIGGVPCRRSNTWWFVDPVFLSFLKDATWASVYEFVKANEEDLKDYGFSQLDELLALKDTPQHLHKYCLAVHAGTGGRQESGSLLFKEELPVPADKPTVTYSDLRSACEFPLGVGRINCRFATANRGVMAVEYGAQVRDWNHRPEFKFFTMKGQKTATYFGLELEVSSQVPWADMHRVLTKIEPVQEEFMYAKSDSSIDGKFDMSYEIVTHPMSPRRMRVEFKRFFKKLEALVAERGHTMSDLFDMDTKSTGIHVHVSSAAFQGTKTHRKKFMLAWNNNAKAAEMFTSTLARRNLRDNTYARPSSEYRGRTVAWCLSRHADAGDRYNACTDTGATVEVRAFRGQVSMFAVRHAIDTTEAMLNFTQVAPISAFQRNFKETFQRWLKKQNRNAYPALKETLSCA